MIFTIFKKSKVFLISVLCLLFILPSIGFAMPVGSSHKFYVILYAQCKTQADATTLAKVIATQTTTPVTAFHNKVVSMVFNNQKLALKNAGTAGARVININAKIAELITNKINSEHTETKKIDQKNKLIVIRTGDREYLGDPIPIDAIPEPLAPPTKKDFILIQRKPSAIPIELSEDQNKKITSDKKENELKKIDDNSVKFNKLKTVNISSLPLDDTEKLKTSVKATNNIQPNQLIDQLSSQAKAMNCSKNHPVSNDGKLYVVAFFFINGNLVPKCTPIDQTFFQ